MPSFGITEQFREEVPNIAEFRVFVDSIPKEKNKLVIKALYLTAARVSELAGKISVYEVEHGKSMPYGALMDWRFADYMNEKVLLLRMVTAKRFRRKDGSKIVREFFRKFVKGEKVSQDLLMKAKNVLMWKVIALPCNPTFEPWTRDLLRYIKKNGTLTLNLTRQRIWEIVKTSLKPLNPKVRTHSLRHWRITHLADFYNFDPYEVVVYAGWTFKTGLNMMGLPSGQLDTYLHLAWKRYFPKLLRPLKT